MPEQPETRERERDLFLADALAIPMNVPQKWRLVSLPNGRQRTCPAFSTDPAAVFGAGGLVDAMRGKGWGYVVSSFDGGHAATFFPKASEEGEGEYVCYATTPCAAVAAAAEAALLA